MQYYCMKCMKRLGDSAVCPHCGYDNGRPGASEQYHLPPGTILAEKYLVGNVIGEGGFGITYIGLHTTLSKRVAIKEYYPRDMARRNNSFSNYIEVPNDRRDIFINGVGRFLDEAKNVARFGEEDGIVDIVDYFQCNGTAYIVMEYLEGETLKSYIYHHGTFSADRIISLMIPLMRSLAAVHDQGVIHRDISPDNIMYHKSGKLKLMDFGSARYFTNNYRKMTVILKLDYSPEEQYRTNGVQGPYTDVYSLCATIYTCITGVVPFSSLDRLTDDKLKRPSELGIKIAPYQENALMHGLAVKAADRTPDVHALIREFTTGKTDYYKTEAPVSFPGGAGAAGQYQPGANIGNGYAPVSGNPNSYRDAYSQKQAQAAPVPRQSKKSNASKTLAIVIPAIAVTAAIVIVAIALNIGKGGSDNKSSSVSLPKTYYSSYSSHTSQSSRSSQIESSRDSSLPATTEAQSSQREPSTTSGNSSSLTSSTTEGITMTQAKSNAQAISKYFFNNLLDADSKAKSGDFVQSKALYYCEAGDTNYRRIVYVFYNSTQKYYRAVEANPDRLYIENGEVKCKYPIFWPKPEADTQKEAENEVSYLTSTTGRYTITELG